MCKCCQLCLESIYWHCFEKWFCYDESIALYEDPEGYGDKQFGNIDPMCYWDSVSVIAGRNIVTIQPLPEDKKSQPLLSNHNAGPKTDNDDNVDSVMPKKNEPIIHHDLTNNLLNNPYQDLGTTIKTNSFRQTNECNNNRLDITEPTLSASCNKIESEEKWGNENELDKQNIFTISLPKLLLDKNFELKLVRQTSMPNFYVETPTETESPHVGTPDVLMSPVLPNTPQFKYDLRSIVEIERSKSKEKISKTDVHSGYSSNRLLNMRKKLTPLIIKPSLHKVPSAKNIS